ncbi:hypothetical protein WME95_40875 [Sorangium sp. So ce327]|jgi:hypothetical protein|uniref:hypothetical protein n=1 Tax=Sorangium sp. So ce327 TaxID=3133301 RepID=UPI003F621860
MYTRARSRRAWDGVRRGLEQAGPRVTARVPKTSFPHPLDAGARPTATWPVGQIADYAIESASNAPPLIIREFDDHFEATIDGITVGERAEQGAETSVTTAMYLGGALLGGAIGTSVTSKREGMFVGAAMGLLFAALVDVALDPQAEPGGGEQ